MVVVLIVVVLEVFVTIVSIVTQKIPYTKNETKVLQKKHTSKQTKSNTTMKANSESIEER